jgi:hypothetical protein
MPMDGIVAAFLAVSVVLAALPVLTRARRHRRRNTLPSLEELREARESAVRREVRRAARVNANEDASQRMLSELKKSRS